MEYDTLNRLLSVYTDADGRRYEISYKYDALNRVTEYKDARGYVIKYKYDFLGNLTEQWRMTHMTGQEGSPTDCHEMEGGDKQLQLYL